MSLAPAHRLLIKSSWGPSEQHAGARWPEGPVRGPHPATVAVGETARVLGYNDSDERWIQRAIHLSLLRWTAALLDERQRAGAGGASLSRGRAP